MNEDWPLYVAMALLVVLLSAYPVVMALVTDGQCQGTLPPFYSCRQ